MKNWGRIIQAPGNLIFFLLPADIWKESYKTGTKKGKKTYWVILLTMFAIAHIIMEYIFTCEKRQNLGSGLSGSGDFYDEEKIDKRFEMGISIFSLLSDAY